MKVWIIAHAGAIADAARRLASTPFATLLSVVAIGTALSLPLAMYISLDQISGLARHVSRDPTVSVFLAPGAGQEEARGIEQRLRQQPQVANVEFLARDVALAELERSAGLEDVQATLGGNPLPDAFVATVRGRDPAAVEALRREVAAWPGIGHVQADSAWARRLQAVLRLGRMVVTVLAVLLAALLAAITFNTIRLQILARKEEIEVSKLIGATDGFVRRPFVYLGLIQGLAGAGVALVIVSTALWILNRDLGVLAGLYGTRFGLVGPGLVEALSVLAAAALLAALAAWLSAGKYLKELEKNTR
jgi:cell division transport system permease protein